MFSLITKHKQAPSGIESFLEESEDGSTTTTMPKFEIKVLSSELWLEVVMQLHSKVRLQVPAGMPPFLVPKSKEYFLDLLNGKSGLLLGAFVGNKLAGITALVFSDSFAQAHDDGIMTCPDESKALRQLYTKKPVAIIQSVCVDQKFGKIGLCKGLIAKALTYAEQAECRDVFVQIATHNELSMKVFQKQGFVQICSWFIDYDRTLLHFDQF